MSTMVTCTREFYQSTKIPLKLKPCLNRFSEQNHNYYHQVKVVDCLSVMGEHGLGIMLTHDIQISRHPVQKM